MKGEEGPGLRTQAGAQPGSCDGGLWGPRALSLECVAGLTLGLEACVVYPLQAVHGMGSQWAQENLPRATTWNLSLTYVPGAAPPRLLFSQFAAPVSSTYSCKTAPGAWAAWTSPAPSGEQSLHPGLVLLPWALCSCPACTCQGLA